ncbi:MAG: NAD kinase [Bacillariaceae sp.]|jgi:NAD kinase
MRLLFGTPLQLALLLILVVQSIIVRAFFPQNKRYVLPNCSYLKAGDKNNNINGDKISTEINNVDNDDDNYDDGDENYKKLDDEKILLDQIASRRTVFSKQSSLPTNTVTSSTAPIASIINKNKSTSSSPYNRKQIPLSAIPDKKVKFNRNSSSEDDANKRKMDLMWCQSDRCQEVVRERVVGDHNTIIFNGPATGQVAYRWNRLAHPIDREESSSSSAKNNDGETDISSTGPSPSSGIASVLLLVKRDDEDLLEIAARNVPKLTEVGIDVLLSPDLAAKLKHYYGVDDERISLFEQPRDPNEDKWRIRHVDDEEEAWVQDMNYVEPFPDLVVTLGGDGLLIYASMLFQGPIPPLLAISGGSLGFLTSFSDLEMTDAIKVALGMVTSSSENGSSDESFEEEQKNALQVFPPNMPYKLPYIDVGDSPPRSTFGLEDYICMTIRMRLDCRVVNREGVVRARYNVLNEVVIDRGSSPYLCALECFCDDVHLTTVQADGVIFAT